MKIKVITTDKAPYHKANETIEISVELAEKMILRGYAKNINDTSTEVEVKKDTNVVIPLSSVKKSKSKKSK